MDKSDMKVFIYILRDPENNSIKYVGQSINPKKRFNVHKCLSMKATKGKKLREWINSLAKKNIFPLFEIIEEVNIKNADDREIFYIKSYRNQGNNIVNETIGGKGSFGYRHTDEIRKKMSEFHKDKIITFIPSMKGKKHTKETKIKMSNSRMGINNHNYGKKMSIDIRDKIKKKLGTEVEINGIKYVSLREAARQLNMNWSTFKYRYSIGLKLI